MGLKRRGREMNKKLLITCGYAVSALAGTVGIITAAGATSPNTIARASSVAGILALFGVTSFVFALISKD
jgi:hypothetical protein